MTAAAVAETLVVEHEADAAAADTAAVPAVAAFAADTLQKGSDQLRQLGFSIYSSAHII